MLPVELLQNILTNALSESVIIKDVKTVGGGSINDCYRLSTSVGSIFVKKNSSSLYPGMFHKEAKGLQILSSPEVIKVPKVLHIEEDLNGESYLFLEWADSSNSNDAEMEVFGSKLAQLHKTSADEFGLDHDNYIGSLPQNNEKRAKWPEFYVEMRLIPQLKMARDSGEASKKISRAFEKLFNKIESLFPEENPSLIHGDLWSGNYMISTEGPVLIDPAVYFGHREMDIAMSKLFGGFGSSFYTGYNNEWPLEKGWEERIDLCNLYPLLVHVNLFGGGYLRQVENILKRFI